MYDKVQLPVELCFKSHITAYTLYCLFEKEASSRKLN